MSDENSDRDSGRDDTSNSPQDDWPETSPSSMSQEQKPLPGNLNPSGPRHSNDHADIECISILPTSDEVMSDCPEYLPTTDSSQWHHDGMRGRLDREWRLFRKESVGPICSTLRFELERLGLGKGDASTYHPVPQDILPYYTYSQAEVIDVDFHMEGGPELLVKFKQPADGHGSVSASACDLYPDGGSLWARRTWWGGQAAKFMQRGNLVCVVETHGSLAFYVVSEATLRTADDIVPRHKNRFFTEERRRYNLADDPNVSFVALNVLDPDDSLQVREALDWFRHSLRNQGSLASLWKGRRPRMIIEFPGTLLPSFQNTLKALQTISKNLDFPAKKPANDFAHLLAPPKDDSNDDTGCEGKLLRVPAPLYSQKPGFQFDLQCMTPDNHPLVHSIDKPLEPMTLSEHSRLDETQAGAFIDSLGRSLAATQGPPGTGKTHEGKELTRALLANKDQAQIGPILIVANTNHALDQMLEHIHDENPLRKIIRVGAQCKSEKLEPMNLKHAVAKARRKRTRLEKSAQKLLNKRAYGMSKHMSKLANQLASSLSSNAVKEYLRKEQGNICNSLFPSGLPPVETGGCQEEDDHFVKVIHDWITAGTAMAPGENREPVHPEELNRRDIHTLARKERVALYQWWQFRSFREVQKQIMTRYPAYVEAKQVYDNARQRTLLNYLEEADIIGMTTAGLAMRFKMLKRLSSKVLLVEEAGEVLEANMLPCLLLPSIQHAILIGDHQQLRPQVQDYNLSSENPEGFQYSLDVSLFERLVHPQRKSDARVPFSRLDTQRRMHPEISSLIRHTLYPTLEDGDNVKQYPMVPGFAQRLFWMQHNYSEETKSRRKKKDPANTSRTNMFEVEMVTALVSYLMSQTMYASGDIAVITPYQGQLQLIQQALSSRTATCLAEAEEDNELLPFEKSGEKELVPTELPLIQCVRAATVDNFQGEEAKVVVISLVRSNRQMQCGFLQTSNRINVLLSRAKEGMYIIGNSNCYARVPMWRQVVELLGQEGKIGPALPVQCPRHPDQAYEVSLPEHFDMACPGGGCGQACGEPLPCDHICPEQCHTAMEHEATECKQRCNRALKGCGHKCPRRCNEPCQGRCTVLVSDNAMQLPCGHSTQPILCWMQGNAANVECWEMVEKTVPGCGHKVEIECHMDVSSSSYVCVEACGADIGCGHRCSKRCCDCNGVRGKGGRTKGSSGHEKCQQCGGGGSIIEYLERQEQEQAVEELIMGINMQSL